MDEKNGGDYIVVQRRSGKSGRKRLMAAVTAGVLSDPGAPAMFVQWASQKGITLPGELLRVTPQGDDRPLSERERENLLKTIGAMSIMLAEEGYGKPDDP